MAKQTFTTGQVLTAAQMTSLQQTAMGGGSATAKTASYVLVAADAGTTVAMNAAGATTITVNTALFAAGDTVFIQNLGAGACTVTAGTATVASAGSLILPQYDAGILYFTATNASIFYDYIQAGGASGPAFRATKSSSQTGVADNTYTKVTFNTETFDTDNCFDNTTNYRFTPTKSGYYSFQVDVTIASSTPTSFCELFYYFNGSSLTPGVRLMTANTGQANPVPSMLYYFDGSSDYMEIYARIEDSGGGRAFQAGYFSGVWIRS